MLWEQRSGSEDLTPLASDPAGGHPSILPEPASPFPVLATNSASSSRTHYTSSGTPTYTAGSTPQASSRWFTLTPNRSAMFLHPRFAVSPLNSGRTLYILCTHLQWRPRIPDDLQRPSTASTTYTWGPTFIRRNGSRRASRTPIRCPNDTSDASIPRIPA